MRITALVVLIVVTVGLFLTTSSHAFLEIWRYYPEGDFDTGMAWNLPAEDDYYVQGYDPADFGIGGPYTIVEVGINTSSDEEGSGPLALHLLLLPTKDSSPDGVPYEYSLTGQTLDWEAGVLLNTYTVDWGVDAGQCVGLVVMGEPPWFEDFVIIMDNGPADTSNWEYYIDGWYHILDDFGYDNDFAYELTVDFTDTSISPASFGVIKTMFN
jgi:hypothetical protein